MGHQLPRAKVQTQTITSVNITAININYTKKETRIEYSIYLADGSIYKRDTLIEPNTDLLNNKSVYARVINAIETM